MNFKKLLLLLLLFFSTFIQAQKNKIDLDVFLDTEEDVLHINQKIVYHNTSTIELPFIYLHNWPNSYKNNKTPLNKRLLEDFKKDFHFSKAKEQGFSNIKDITVNDSKVNFENYKIDVLKVNLNNPLQPKDSIVISANYKVKIPDGKFTKYGKTQNGYHLRYWYLVPAAIQNNEWQTMSNLNLDDLLQDIADYNIKLQLPSYFSLTSNLTQKIEENSNIKSHILTGSQRKDIIINIDTKNSFKSFQTKSTLIKTDAFKRKKEDSVTQKILQKEITFIENKLGEFPHKELLIDKRTINKNGLKELYGLPEWMRAYPENFKYELQLLQGLSTTFIDNTFILNKRNDQWLVDGLQTYLMIEYIKEFYPDLNLWGRYSDIWGFRTYKLSQIKQKDKYAIIYQLRARKLLNQRLTMSADSLSNINKKVVNKFKAGLALEYLQDYLGDSITNTTLNNFYDSENLKVSSSEVFKTTLTQNTNKNLDWFLNDFLNSEKNIDYKIKKVKTTPNKDSLKITIKNLNKITSPVSLYTINGKNIISKTWLHNIDSTTTVTIANHKHIDKVSLNYEQAYPEFNSLDNYKKTNNSIIKKTLKLKFSKDFEDPFYTQIFFDPKVKYNLYDGVLLGVVFNNKHFIKHNFQYSISPSYAFGSKELSGKFAADYSIFHKNSETIYKTIYGIAGSSFNYDENLRYKSFSPYSILYFRRKNLRSLANSAISAKLNYIDRETYDSQTEEDNYTLFNLKYAYRNHSILKDTRFSVGTEFASNFSKITSQYRYIHYFSKRRSFDVRLYGGIFLNNATKSDYFNFNATRGSDYLFQHRLIGGSEDTGFFSQQYIVADGGLKSSYNRSTSSNSQIYTANTSIGVWNWLEIYNNTGILKNKHQKESYFYENGLRLNFISDFFEIYLPVYTNEGWEINSSSNYSSKIRFTITTQFKTIYNFFRRDFL